MGPDTESILLSEADTDADTGVEVTAAACCRPWNIVTGTALPEFPNASDCSLDMIVVRADYKIIGILSFKM